MNNESTIKKFSELNNNDNKNENEIQFKLSKKSVWVINTEPNGNKMNIKCWNKYLFNFEYQFNNIINDITNKYGIDIKNLYNDLCVKTEGQFNVIKNIPIVEVNGIMLPNIIVKKIVEIYTNLFD